MNSLQLLKSTALFLTLFLMPFNLSANEDKQQQSKSYFEHLVTINKEWKHYNDISPIGQVCFSSDLDRIQFHLQLVIENLKTNIPTRFNTIQKAKRLNLLNKLQEYSDRKVFPINQSHSVRTPYFVDHLGTNCAVGQMIYVSGHEDLVAKISQEHNYDYIMDIKIPGIHEWANEFGFTIEKLKWIQPVYAPEETMDQVLNRTNGRVKKIVLNTTNSTMMIAGEFTELDNSPCLNIGYYSNNQLTCYGNGIDGIINDIVLSVDGVLAIGEFEHEGKTYPIARYHDSNWSYISIPGRSNAVGMVAHFGGADYYHYELEVSISHSSILGHQEVWHWLEDGSWSKRMLVNGEVNDFAASGVGRVHAGHFDTVTVYNHSGVIDTIMQVNNAIIRENSGLKNYYSIGNQISNEVNAVISIGSAIYFAGKCDAIEGNNVVCISRCQNSILQPIFMNNVSEDEINIKSIAFDGNRTLALGGDFNKEFSWTYGDNLATFDIVSNQFMPIAVLDEPVNSVLYFENDLYVGGDFQTNFSTESINYLGIVSSTVGLKEESKAEIKINVYPNPFNNEINIEGLDAETNYSILHLDGRIVKEDQLKEGENNGLDFLPKGSYLLRFDTLRGSIVRKIMK